MRAIHPVRGLGLALLLGWSSVASAQTSEAASAPVKTPVGMKAGCQVPEEGPSLSPTRFEVSYMSKEISRDSHSTRWKGRFDGRILTVYGPYGECVRGQCEHKEVRLVLTPEEVTALDAQLVEMALWDPMVEVHEPLSGASSSHQTTASIFLSDGQRSAGTTIQYGSAHTGRERQENGSPEAFARASAIRNLLMSMQTTSQRCYPDFSTGR